MSATELKTAEKTVNISVLYNLLDTEDRTDDKLVWRADATIADYLNGLPDDVDWVTSVNGGIIESENFEAITLSPDDYLVVAVQPRGGGGGGNKKVLRLVAMIAIAVVAYQLAPLVLGEALAAEAVIGSLTAGELFVAGVSMAAGMIMDAFAPAPSLPTAPNPGSSFTGEDSPTYGIDGAKNTSQENLPVPLVYGTFRMGGNRAHIITINDGNTQYVRVQQIISEGKIKSISEFEIDNQPIENFNDVETQVRLGVNNQELMGWFDDAITLQSRSVRLTNSYSTFITTQVIDKFRIDLVAPSGLLRIDETSGNRLSYSVPVTIQYRKQGEVDWVSLVSGQSVSDATRNTVRRSFESPVLEQAVYEIRVKRDTADSDDSYISDDLFWGDIAEIVIDDVRYNYTAYFGLGVRLTDQLSRLPTVTAKIEGREVNTYDVHGNVLTNEFTANCAWVTLDILLSARYGGNMDPTRIDWPAFVEWAEYCTENNLEFNGAIDFLTNIWEAIKMPCRIGHAQVVPVGTKYSVIVDKPSTPVMMYGMGNIVQDSFTVEWLPKRDRVNEIEVTYYDEEDSNKRKTIRVVDFDQQVQKAQDRKVLPVNVIGMVRKQDAYDYGERLLNQNRLIKKTVTFDAPVEAIASNVGQVVLVAHDLTNWAETGRLEDESTTTVIKLDRGVTMQSGKNYKLLIHDSALKRWDATVEVIGASSIFVSGISDTSLRLNRLIEPSGQERDLEIIQVNPGDPYDEIVLRGAPTGFSVDQAVELWDTDVVEERDVVLDVGTDKTEVTVSPAFSFTPQLYANWMFGETNKVKNPYRVFSIQGFQEDTRSLRVVQYDEDVYTASGVVAAAASTDSYDFSIGSVSDISFDEELYYTGSGVRTRLYVAWQPPVSGFYEGAEVFVDVNSTGYVSRGSVRGGGTRIPLEVEDGQTLDVKVVPFDGLGNRQTFSAAAWDQHIVIGKTAVPADVQNFTVKKVVGGIEFEWDKVDEVDIAGYTIKEGTTWASGTEIVEEVLTTKFNTVKSKTGTFTWHIKAIDTGGRESETATQVTLTVTGPGDVTDFTALQNAGQVQLDWNEVNELGIAGYEIREGVSWEAGRKLAFVQASRFITPTTGNDSDRTFWIKAIDTSNVESDTAVFASPKIVESQIHNVLYELTESDDDFLGHRIFMEDVVDGLRMEEDTGRCEYVFTGDLGGSTFCRCICFEQMVFVSGGSLDLDWTSATFTWSDPEANVQWVEEGNSGNLLFERFIAHGAALGSEVVEAFTFDNTTTGENGEVANTATAVAYAKGRFSDGVDIGATTALDYDLTGIANDWTMAFWVTPLEAAADRTIMTWDEGGANSCIVRYDNTGGGNIEVEFESSGDTLSLPFDWTIDSPFMVIISQAAAETRLFVADYLENVGHYATAARTPTGTYAVLDLTPASKLDCVISDLVITDEAMTQAEMGVKFDRASPIGFGEFITLIEGQQDFDHVAFKYRFKSLSDGRPTIETLKVTFDVEDVRDRGQETIAASKTTINFNRTFTVPPVVTGIQVGGATPAYVEVTNVTTTGFDAEMKSYASDTTVAGTFNWIGEGY